eukprot:gene2583-30971_t
MAFSYLAGDLQSARVPTECKSAFGLSFAKRLSSILRVRQSCARLCDVNIARDRSFKRHASASMSMTLVSAIRLSHEHIPRHVGHESYYGVQACVSLRYTRLRFDNLNHGIPHRDGSSTPNGDVLGTSHPPNRAGCPAHDVQSVRDVQNSRINPYQAISRAAGHLASRFASVIPPSSQTPLVAGGETQLVAGGETQLVADGETQLVAGGETQLVAGGETQLVAGGETQLVAGGETQLVAGGETQLVAGGETQLVAGGETQLVAGSETQLVAGGETQLVAGGETQLVV